MSEILRSPSAPPIPHSSRRLLPFLLALFLASAIDAVAWWLLGRLDLAPAARIAIALLPLPGNVTLIVMALARIRRLDEFQKRLEFEAVKLAFLSTGVAVFIYAYLQKAQVAGPLSMVLVWAFMIVFYAIGRLVAASHYR